MPESNGSPSPMSLRALDSLNFFLADVRDGPWPYLAIYLTSNRHWDASRVGIAMAAMLIGTVIAQTPAPRSSSIACVGIQLLHGVGAGIFGVVSLLVVADLTWGSVRFKFTQGASATATVIGAALSYVVILFVVHAAGFNAGFVTLAAIAVAVLLFYAAAMPETHDFKKVP